MSWKVQRRGWVGLLTVLLSLAMARIRVKSVVDQHMGDRRPGEYGDPSRQHRLHRRHVHPPKSVRDRRPGQLRRDHRQPARDAVSAGCWVRQRGGARRQRRILRGRRLPGCGGTEIRSLVHLLANGTLDTNWNPPCNFIVRALALSGTTLYVGGESPRWGTARNGLGAVSTQTGLALPWNPNIGPMGGGVGATVLAVVGSTVFAGGPIRGHGGGTTPAQRNGFVAVDATTGALQPWTPRVDVNGFVEAMIAVGNTLYLGGAFSFICPNSASTTCNASTAGVSARNAIAAIDATNGTVLPFNPNLGWLSSRQYLRDGSVGTTMYVGGFFTGPNFGGQNRNHLAAINLTTGTVLDWNPNAGSATCSVTANPCYVEAIGVVGSTAYIAGGFRNMGGQPRNRIAAVSATATGAGAGALLPFNPNANDQGSRHSRPWVDRPHRRPILEPRRSAAFEPGGDRSGDGAGDELGARDGLQPVLTDHQQDEIVSGSTISTSPAASRPSVGRREATSPLWTPPPVWPPHGRQLKRATASPITAPLRKWRSPAATSTSPALSRRSTGLPARSWGSSRRVGPARRCR